MWLDREHQIVYRTVLEHHSLLDHIVGVGVLEQHRDAVWVRQLSEQLIDVLSRQQRQAFLDHIGRELAH